MKDSKQTEVVLPLSVESKPNVWDARLVDSTSSEMWVVLTNGGFTTGSRLLKGVSPPNIEDFGPFKTEAEAGQLAERLTKHIEEDWPQKKRRKRR